MKTEVGIAIKMQDVLGEVNKLQKHMDEHLVGLSNDALERTKTIQLLALGVLFKKWMDQNPASSQTQYERIVSQIAYNIESGGPG